MARKIARIEATDESAEWYVPDVGDNRDDGEPFKVLLRPMTAAEMMKLERRHGQQLTATRGNAHAYVRDIEAAVFSKAVLRVEGYEVQTERDGRTLRPTNGRELIEALQHVSPAEYRDVTDDIYKRIREGSSLDEDAKKKPALLSVGS